LRDIIESALTCHVYHKKAMNEVSEGQPYTIELFSNFSATYHWEIIMKYERNLILKTQFGVLKEKVVQKINLC